METHPLTAKNWSIVALIALVIGLWFVMPYLGVIALAALMAFLFNGMYTAFSGRMRAGAAASLTFLVSLLVVLVPVIIVSIFTIFQLGQLTTDISNEFGRNFSSLPDTLQSAIANVNNLVAHFGGDGQLVTSQGVLDFLKNILPGIIAGVTAFVGQLVGGIPMMIILAIMYVFLFYEFLVYGKKITQGIVALSPFQPEVTRMYLARVGLMANAMSKGQLMIALILGALEALVIAFFFNAWEFFVLMTVAFSFFNLIPLGAGIIAYPLIIIGMLMGAVWPGVGALIVISIVSNLESFLRPRFIPKSITLTNGLTMLAAFGGITLYGILGVVYGPIIMIVIVTSIQMYLDYYQELPRWKKKANQTAP